MVTLEIIAPLVGGLKHCQQCTPYLDDSGISERILKDELNSVPEDVWQDYSRLSEMVRDVKSRHGEQVRIIMVDPRSPMGFWKSIRHWVRRYPTFVVNGREKYTGWDRDALEHILSAAGTHAAA